MMKRLAYWILHSRSWRQMWKTKFHRPELL